MSDIAEDGTLKPGAKPLDGKKAGDVPNLGVALVHPNGSANTKEGTVLRNVGEGTATIGAPQNADDKVGKAKEGLADLDKSKDTNGLSVADAKKLGFVIKGKAADGTTDVTGQVKHANTVEFAGEDLAKVITESKDGNHKVTVKVDKNDVAQAVNAVNAKKGTTPTTYVDRDGNPLVKGDDGNYYKVKDDGTLDKDGGAVDPVGVRLGEKDKPIQLTNVAPATKEITTDGPTKGLADLANDGTVATVADLKKLGFVIKGKAADGTTDVTGQVKHANTVEFAGEDLAKVITESANGASKVTVKVNKEDIVKVVNDANDKKGSAPTQYVDKDGNPLVKAKDGKYYPKDKVGEDGNPQTGVQPVEPAGIQVGEKGKTTQLTNVAPATEAINNPNDPTNGLANLAKANDGTVATVADLKKLGFVVADGADYHATVTNAQTVKFVGEGLAEVTGETKDNVRTFTVKVDDKKVADAVKAINDKAGNAPTQYVDKDGNPLVKAKDGKYYPKDKVGDDGTPQTGAQAVEPAGIQVGEKGKTTQLTNVAPATEAINNPNDPTNGLANLAKANDGTVATVADLKKLGFVIKGKAADGTTDVTGQVKHANTVEFAGEDLAKVITESANGESKVTVKVNKEDIVKVVNDANDKKGSAPTQYVDKDGNPLVKAKDGKYYPKDKVGDDGTPQTGAQAVDPVGIQVGEKDKPTRLMNIAPGTTSIAMPTDPNASPVDKAKGGLADLSIPTDAAAANVSKHTAATVDDLRRMGWILSVGDTYADKVQNAQEVNFKGAGLAEVSGQTEGQKRVITVTVDEQKVAAAVKAINDKAGNTPIQYVDDKGNPLVKVGDKYYTKDQLKDDGQPKPDEKEAKNVVIQVGDKNKPKQLTNVAAGTSEIKEGPTKGLADLEHATSGTVATVDDLQKLGFVIKGKAADGTTDVVAQVRHANTVEFAGDGLAKVITESKDGVSKVTVKVNKEEIAKAVNAENAKNGSAPIQYVDKDGNSLVKDGDKYYKAKDDGTPDTDAGEKTPAGVQIGEKDKPITVTNVKSNFAAVAPDAKEAKAPESKKNPDGSVDPTAANPLVAMQHNAATIADIMNSPWNLQVNGKAVKAVKSFDTVNITDGTNTKVVATETGYKVNVVGLPTAYTDNAGHTIAKGADGKWFVTDKDGNMTATPADLGQDGKGTPSVSLVNPAAEPGKAGEPVVMHNVGKGNAPTDAVNKEQMDEAFAKLGNSVAGVQSEMRNVGADAAALAALKPLQYDPLEPTQIMAGVGLYKNNNAVALGIAHYTNESTLFHAGISFGGSQNMINLGITKKFGHHDKKENQVQDRYRSGPISSVYIMQDEVEALKAENREQKKEIEELKAMVMQLMNKQK